MWVLRCTIVGIARAENLIVRKYLIRNRPVSNVKTIRAHHVGLEIQYAGTLILRDNGQREFTVNEA
ncbi:hypothetical protein D3C86_2050460 [compost metagenome]